MNREEQERIKTRENIVSMWEYKVCKYHSHKIVFPRSYTNALGYMMRALDESDIGLCFSAIAELEESKGILNGQFTNLGVVA